ncbi:MAG: tyrosine-type recombinase/integrase [Bacteroidetes bacterium]|nr:tyrosine-type recombinase/integrase [Bacteroidota bacterium]MBT3800760.1 tyrosine-type recombinase/integrase [Bacteroidota bacterium]MBT4727064.1 tyrosine-type recombinase/integrase [Bacteroidota bacterium]MBT5989955.1 tyrosine-type recombinase/integrase [Bacteroidota bacterium]MBT6834825.1 tyrosine-type recombinase/integrase [Bacteroidota bacterium]
MKALTSIILDTRRSKSNGLFPVKLRITYNRQQKYYPTDFDLSPNDFKAVYEPNPRKNYKAIRNKFDDIETDARKVVEKLSVFSFKKFESTLFNLVKSTYLKDYYDSYIMSLENEGKIKTAESYRCSINSLITFANDKLKCDDINFDFLKEYEKWMLKSKKSYSTIGIYLRSLRSIINKAINDGSLHPDLYPFGKNQYQIKKAPKSKKALKPSDIEVFFKHDYKSLAEKEKAKNFWFFSFFGNGINFKDIANLRYKNIDGDYCCFLRAKTTEASSEVIEVRFYLLSELKKIISKYGNKNRTLNNYIFPILKEGMSPKDQNRKIAQFIKTTNKWLGRISEDLKLEFKITTYTARHSFATHLKNKNASTEYISESLGHSNIYTTKAYLDSFGDELKKKNAEELLKF